MSGPVPGGAHVGDRLSAYLDGELPEMERAQVEAHVRDCVPCSEWLSELQAVDDCAQELAVEAPEGYFDAFPGRVRARLAARRRPRVPVWTWAAAAAVLLAVITPLTLREIREPGAAAPPAPASTIVQGRIETETAAASPASPPLLEKVQTRGSAAPAATPASSADGLTMGDKLRATPLPAPRTQDEARLQERDAARSFDYAEGAREEQQAAAKKEAATAARADADRSAESYRRQAPPPQDAPAAGPGRAAVPQQAQPAPPPAAAPVPAPTVPPTLAAANAKPAEGGVAGGTPGGLVGGFDDTRAEPEAKAKGDTNLGLRRRQAAVAGEDATTTTGGGGAAALEKRATAKSKDFDALAQRTAASAEQSRALYRDWATFAARHRGTAEGDEARVRALEALAAAWRLERRPADRTLARALGEAYVKEPGRQVARVRALLDELTR